jgi:hypothetical protein
MRATSIGWEGRGLTIRGQNPRKATRKKREMKEEPTISLITKHRFYEPTMLMKKHGLSLIGHDVMDRKRLAI